MAVFHTNTSDTVGAPASDDNYVKPQDIAAASILLVICIVGIVGNTFVIVAVQLSRRLQTPTNVFVVTLSCTDLLTALTLPFQASSLLVTKEAHPAFAVVCKVIGALTFIVIGWSIITLAAIAFNRYILITQTSQRYRRIFCKRNIIIILALDLSYPILAVIIFGATGWAVFGKKYYMCAAGDNRYFYILSGVSMVTMMAAILYFYVKIYLHVRNHVRRVNNKLENQMPQPSSTQPSSEECEAVEEKSQKEAIKKDNRKSTEVKITQNMLLIVLCFFICMLPMTLGFLAVDLETRIMIYCFVVLSLNCCLNPVVYAWKHPVFRQVFRCMITCRLSDIEEPTRWLRERLF